MHLIMMHFEKLKYPLNVNLVELLFCRDENGIKGSGSFDQDAEKVPLDEDVDSLDYGDDEGSKFNEDGSFIGQYGTAEKENETNASSIV